MKALVVNTVGGPFDFEDVDIAAPLGREVLVDVRASGLCHTDLLFGTHDFAPTPLNAWSQPQGSGPRSVPTSRGSASEIMSSGAALPVQILGSKLQFELLAKDNAKEREVSPLQVNCPEDEAGRFYGTRRRNRHR
jgi:hypothetical protein